MYVVRNVALKGITIHSNTLFSDIDVDELPEGLILDPKHRKIIGTYTGDDFGFFNFHITISNRLGSYSKSFQFILSNSLNYGMSYTFYDAPCDMNLTTILPDTLIQVKEGISSTTDIHSSELTSFLFTPSSSCQLLVFSSLLRIPQAGYYSFQMSDDSPIAHVLCYAFDSCIET